MPLSIGRGSWEDLDIQGYVPAPGENMKIYRSIVAPGFFDVLGIPILAGRDFTLSDDRDHAPAMIVNQEFVRRLTAVATTLLAVALAAIPAQRAMRVDPLVALRHEYLCNESD